MGASGLKVTVTWVITRTPAKEESMNLSFTSSRPPLRLMGGGLGRGLWLMRVGASPLRLTANP